MRFFASLTSILFALLLSSLAFADESLTWEACVKEALENNLTIKMTKESLIDSDLSQQVRIQRMHVPITWVRQGVGIGTIWAVADSMSRRPFK